MEAAVAKALIAAVPATIKDKMWTYLSKHQLRAAAKFAKLSGDFENEHKGQSSPDLLVEHRAYVMASILMAVAFLEATINELFALAVDGRLSGLRSEVTAIMANMWRRFNVGRRLATLDKYQLALMLADKQLLNAAAGPYQDVQLVLRLRNALVHYVPEWETAGVDTEPEATLTNLKGMLRQKKFDLNPFAKGKPFYPDKCLSHGCAKWAVESSLEFTDDFFSRMGLQPPYADVRAALGTE